jgi:hypothetical protein
MAPDLCAIGVLEGRPIALRQAARRQAITRPELLVPLQAPCVARALLQMRVSSATPGYLNPGTRKGLAPITADGGIACTQETRAAYHHRDRAQARKGGRLRGLSEGGGRDEPAADRDAGRLAICSRRAKLNPRVLSEIAQSPRTDVIAVQLAS